MTKISASIITQIGQAVRRAEPNAEIILFGSRARGDARPDSDWDVLVLLDGKVTLAREQKIYRLIGKVELATEEVLSVIIYEKDYWQQILKDTPLYDDIEREGLTL
ncbi:nucleotidyltransferase domain-containing protein [Tunicatimonas pelagia]|uniref:nucleotidyltransferase domain-containing protein n=1 Tax=Tunicatimonas pelagia TaxID=931531 RepID=UPI0026657334|nr:nucleotidyltransferase domain-containing protein [Tunicatimonas pelagia]WKN46121.1 nucleotidyltransferase domain-containing protein [Tunicatimonas pelagia]